MMRPGHCLVLALLVPALVSCDDVTGPEPGDDRPVSEWILDNGPYHDLLALSGSGPGTLYASGEAGVVLRYEGSEWVDVGPPFPRASANPGYTRSRHALYSPAPGEFFTADWNRTIWHCDDSECVDYPRTEIPGDVRHIQAIWGTSGSDVYVTGLGADILHFDGTSWSAIAGVSQGYLNAIWGFPSGEVFAAGDNVVHYDGATWTTTPAATQLSGIWGSAPDDVYAVGGHGDGHVQHFDGTQWRVVDVGVDGRTTAVWGSASTDVFVAGDDGGFGVEARGVILHFDGTGWSRMSIGMGVPPLRAVWGTGPSDVWAAGDQGVVLHYDGTLWRTVRGGLGRRLTGVDGVAETNLYVVGDHTVLRNTGSGWNRIVEEQHSRPFTGVDVVGITPYLTAELRRLYRHNGAALRRVDIPMYAPEAVWGTSREDIFVVGGSPGVARLGASGWTTGLADHRLSDVWGATGSDVYAVGRRWDSDTYRGAVVHFDGESWTGVEITRMRYAPHGVWGSSESDVFVVGENGVILHWDGEGWEEMESGTFETLVAVRGSAHDNVYAVGTRGTILRYDGNAWAPVTLPFQVRGTFNDVWVRKGYDVVVVGDAGTIVRGVR